MKMSPKEFMKMRRPGRFSDTVISKKGALNRSILEYKLDVLTSNSQEQAFQNFCFKLAQLEIAPNLRPQTGPTGGGDSKADTETYPVSEFTKLNFWEGIGNDARDRWAFAISAKRQWVSKAGSDAKGIAATGRNYKRIFFITNQFTKDKKRAEAEDKLSNELSIPVTILDRTWILDRVFENNRQKIAIEELDLGEGMEDEVIVGPNDTERSRMFESLNNEIEQALNNAIITIPIADKALGTALLGRGMGNSRAEVDGLFDRAIKLAEKLGVEEQLYSVKYEKAWTTFFWFEDFPKFIKLYDELEPIMDVSANIYTIQRQNNLAGLLRTLTMEDIPKDFVQTKFTNLNKRLTEFANEDTRPSASHQAKMLLALNKLFDDAADRKDLNNDFKEIGVILQGADRLIGFPYEESIGIILENGDVFGDIPEFEKLINLIAEIDTKRKGEIPAAKSFLNYGIQHLEAGRNYKAIEYIGRSLIGLYKKESKQDFIYALYFIAYAYEAVGLLWAARGSLIHAASYATEDLRQHQEINELQAKCCRRLKMIELRLGRVGHTLEWHEVDLVLSQQLALTQKDRDAVLEESLGNFSGLLGCLLLKTRTEDLSKLEKVPDIFNRLAVDFSCVPLLYLLGGEEYLPPDFWQTIGEQPVKDFFDRWWEQPAIDDLPDHPNFYLDQTVRMESNILGTHYILETKNASPGIEICETVIAALEAYLATALPMQLVGKVSEFKIITEENPELNSQLQLVDSPPNGRNIKVYYKPFNPHLLSVEVQTQISKAVTEIVIRTIGETIALPDAEKSLKELIVDQRVDQRSFNFLSSLVMLGNVLGHNPRRSINQWINEQDTEYAFDGDTSRLKPVTTKDPEESLEKSATEITEKEIFDIKGHQHIKTFSVINETYWAGHVWRGFAFAIDPNLHALVSPTLYLMFDDRQAAINIFSEWNERFGDKAGEKIKITILKGIDADNPYWYKGLISSNIRKEEMKNGNTIIMMTKVSTMTPNNPRNLESFLESYRRFGYFNLAPFYIKLGSEKQEPMDELGFVIKDLCVKNAWEVGVTDMENTAIHPTDNPVIPQGLVNAPVLEVLKMKHKK